MLCIPPNNNLEEQVPCHAKQWPTPPSVFIVSPISPSHLRWCIYRFLLPLNHRIAFRIFIMHWQTQDILIFFSKVVLQMPLAIIILFNVMGYLTIHLLDRFQVI